MYVCFLLSLPTPVLGKDGGLETQASPHPLRLLRRHRGLVTAEPHEDRARGEGEVVVRPDASAEVSPGGTQGSAPLPAQPDGLFSGQACRHLANQGLHGGRRVLRPPGPHCTYSTRPQPVATRLLVLCKAFWSWCLGVRCAPCLGARATWSPACDSLVGLYTAVLTCSTEADWVPVTGQALPVLASGTPGSPVDPRALVLPAGPSPPTMNPDPEVTGTRLTSRSGSSSQRSQGLGPSSAP